MLSSIQELARRLCVIELEDVVLHPDTPLLVWCMAVSDYEYSQEMLESILQIVSDLARVQYCDVWVKHEQADLYKLYKESGVLCKCILIRAFYRGMAGDVKLLSDYAQTWNIRLADDQWEKFLCTFFGNLPLVDFQIFCSQYSYQDTLLEGVDFHCTNMLDWLLGFTHLVEKISVLGFNDPQEYLKSAIWSHRSSINLRNPLNLHPEVGCLISYTVSEPTQPDELYLNEVLPLVTEYSKAELKKRLKFPN